MKKLTVLLVLILLVAGLTGCQKEEKANESAAVITNTPAPEITEPPVTEPENTMTPATDEAWTCSECGKESTGAFCSWCGAKKPDPIICPECGAEYPAGSNFLFCNKCGAALTAEEQTPEPEEIKWIVSEVNWKRTVKTEEYKPFQESSWDQPPASA